MKHSPKAVTFPIVLALALAGGNVFAAAPDAKGVSAEQIKAGLPAEVAQDGQKFANEAKDTELRHRVNEDNAQGEAVRERKELKEQQDKQAQHKYQKKIGEPKQMEKSGSFGAFSGKGPSGGNGGGGGRR